jgi:hypothetical protein
MQGAWPGRHAVRIVHPSALPDAQLTSCAASWDSPAAHGPQPVPGPSAKAPPLQACAVPSAASGTAAWQLAEHCFSERGQIERDISGAAAGQLGEGRVLGCGQIRRDGFGAQQRHTEGRGERPSGAQRQPLTSKNQPMQHVHGGLHIQPQVQPGSLANRGPGQCSLLQHQSGAASLQGQALPEPAVTVSPALPQQTAAATLSVAGQGQSVRAHAWRPLTRHAHDHPAAQFVVGITAQSHELHVSRARESVGAHNLSGLMQALSAMKGRTAAAALAAAGADDCRAASAGREAASKLHAAPAALVTGAATPGLRESAASAAACSGFGAGPTVADSHVPQQCSHAQRGDSDQEGHHGGSSSEIMTATPSTAAPSTAPAAIGGQKTHNDGQDSGPGHAVPAKETAKSAGEHEEEVGTRVFDGMRAVVDVSIPMAGADQCEPCPHYLGCKTSCPALLDSQTNTQSVIIYNSRRQ